MSMLRTLLVAALLSVTALFSVQGQAPAQRDASAASAVTYDQVIQMLALGIDEDAILKRLAKSPTLFTLSADQVAALKKAGASEKILSAMQTVRAATDAAAELITDVAIILDCSGSMRESTRDRQTKMTIAKQVITELVQKIPDGLNVTFIIYGHEVFGGADDPRNCQAVKVVRPLSRLDTEGKSELAAVISRLQPTGATPIALSLKVAGTELAKNDAFCGLVLVTDGKETCKGDPAAEAAALAQRLKCSFGVNVVGFDVNADERKSLEEIASAGKGKYYNAQTAAELQQAIGAIGKKLLDVAKPAPEVVSNRRAIRVALPQMKLPPLKSLALIKAGEFGPDTPSNYRPIAEGKKYDEEIRLPSTDEYDLLWIPEEGRFVRMTQKLSVKERKLVQLKPEEYLGIVRVHAAGLPRPKTVALTKVDAFGPDTPSNFEPIQLASEFEKDMVVPAGTYDVWLKPADGSRAQRLEQKLEVAAGQVVDVGGAAAEGRAAGRRALKVLSPAIKLPPLKAIVAVKKGDFGPDTPSNYNPVTQITSYDQELRLPSADEYDVLWVPQDGHYVRMLRGFSIKERKIVEVKPEQHLGIVRVGGNGLAAPRVVALTRVGDFGPDTPSNFRPVQMAAKYGVDMVAPTGTYDLWLKPASGGKAEKLEEKLEVKAGEALVLD